MYYIYFYLDPRKPGKFSYKDFEFEYEPFYIGKGHGARMYDHLNYAKKKTRKSFVVSKIKAIRKQGLEPIVKKIMEFDNEDTAYLHEAMYIKEIGRIDLETGPLTNLTDGGIGGKSIKRKPWTEELRAKHMAYRKNNGPRKGMKNSAEMRERQSIAKKDKKFTDEHKKSLSKAKSTNPVELILDDGTIEEFDNVKLLAEYIGESWSSIYPALRNDRKYKHYNIRYKKKTKTNLKIT